MQARSGFSRPTLQNSTTPLLRSARTPPRREVHARSHHLEASQYPFHRDVAEMALRNYFEVLEIPGFSQTL